METSERICTAEKVQETLQRTIEFLEEHQAIIDCHVVDFLWENHWERLLPAPLREELESNKEEIIKNIHGILSGSSSCDFQQFKQFLTRATNHSLASFPQVATLEDLLPEKESPLKVSDFMTPKKMHEVKSTSRLVSWLCKDIPSTVVVDAGDGKGYLSSCLAFEYNLPVIGLEANADYQKSARKRVEKLKKKWKTPEREENYKSLAVTVTSDIRISDISKNLFPTFNQANYCLCGLHTCGDLAVSCLEIFTKDPHVKYLCNIACCYNLLSRFPISSYLGNKGFTLSDKAKMLACQSLNKIISDEALPKDSLHFRTLFEKLLKQKYPQRKFEHLGKIRSDNFIEYFKSSCDKMNLEYFYSDYELREELIKYDRMYFDLFYVLRSSLAAAVEAVILLDRLLFLMECNEARTVHLIKLFQQEISPRCYAIIAVKK